MNGGRTRFGSRALRALWPRGLGGRSILVLSVAVVMVHLGTIILYTGGSLDQADTFSENHVADRLAAAAQVLAVTPKTDRDGRAHALSSPDLALHWGSHAATEARGVATLPGFRRRLHELAPDLGPMSIKFSPPGTTSEGAMLNGSVGLADGTFLNFGSALPGRALPEAVHSTLVSTTLMAVGVVAIAAVLLRGLIRPLRRLALAADAIGRGPVVTVSEAGPEEVRHVAQAFNGMQTRIHRLLHDRTQALAAVSHDLRTPITRLRLRAGFLADSEMQAAIDADLEEMERMIEATLAYLRGDAESEPRQMADLAALLSTLTDDVTDAGGIATYAGPNHVALPLHVSAVKRAFANLVNNAVTYGGCVHVTVRPTGTGVTVTIEDDGPGIAEGDVSRLFQPFERLEQSRNRGTGGVGLGLAIARQAIENECGSIRLGNREAGGLRIEVFLPGAAVT